METRGAAQARIILDCTHTFHTGANTGIQRLVRRLADGLLAEGRARGVEVVPARVEAGALHALPTVDGRVDFPRAASAREAVAGEDETARRLQRLRALGHRLNLVRSRGVAGWLDAGPNADGLMRRTVPAGAAPAGALRLGPADVLLLLDSSWVYDIRTILDEAGRAGATRVAVVCDVLSLTDPQWFTEGTRRWFGEWLEAILPRLEGLVGISQVTLDEISGLVDARKLRARRLPAMRAIHLGAEIEAPAQPRVRADLQAAMRADGPPTFLTVGTLEPRKNHGFALDVFDALLARGHDVAWHFVGAPGWLAEATLERIRTHPEHGARLRWWTDLGDGELQWAYQHATALVAVSHAEGFGLPLVEARLHGLPVFASDIAVFREVLGEEARYLPLASPQLAAAALEDFLLGRYGPVRARPASRVARSWAASARELAEFALSLRAASNAETNRAAMARQS